MLSTRPAGVTDRVGQGERILRGGSKFRILPFLGPAFIAAVAYIDPGNFATNIAGGSKFGYTLVWVIVASNLMAMLIQTLSAKLGIATGMNLPEVCREHFDVASGLRAQPFGDGVQTRPVACNEDEIVPAMREPVGVDGADA